MRSEKRFGKMQTAVLVVIALVMGANLISPAVGHVKKSIKHLYKHLDPRYINVGEKATSAATADNATNANNANNLDNLDSTAFVRTDNSRVFEHRLSTPIAGAAGTDRTLTLSGLPAGSYAIYGKALLGTTAGSGMQGAQCVLTAGTSSDLSFERTDAGFYAHINTELVHAFAAPGSVSMACQFFSQPWIFGAGANDTRIIAVKLNSDTKTSGVATRQARSAGSGSEGATG
jgi:hypothetical protein